MEAVDTVDTVDAMDTVDTVDAMDAMGAVKLCIVRRGFDWNMFNWSRRSGSEQT